MDGAYDCILIDGDHNWYTVINELKTIRQRGLLRPGGRIFFHDIEWPYGRRDIYYQPETIPEPYRLEYAQKGILRGQRALDESHGSNRNLYNAVREGGPRNGVLTAVEDFIADHPSEYMFCRIRKEFGLGILQSRSADPVENRAFDAIRKAAARQNREVFPAAAKMAILCAISASYRRKVSP